VSLRILAHLAARCDLRAFHGRRLLL